MSQPIHNSNTVIVGGGHRGSAKSVGAAYLIWLLLGLLGGHKFYLGRVGMGVLYLFTVGLFGIGWIIDLFTLPTQVKAANGSRY